MTLRYLKNNEIDFQKWDKCIRKSLNGTIYGYSWFLNIVSEDWDALVDETYETVMPLTWKKFLGIKVLVQPAYANNLGVYSMNVPGREEVKTFLDLAGQKYPYIDINLNKYNKLSVPAFTIRRESIYEIDLIPDYQRIHKAYSEKVKRRLELASEKRISVISGLNSNDLIHLYLYDKSWWWKILFRNRINQLRMLISTSVKFRVGQIYGAYTRENNLCGAGLFVWSHQKVILLFLGLNRTGIKESALETLIDEFIKLHAGQNLTLRFEHAHRKLYSDIYMGFGGRKFEFMRLRKYNLQQFMQNLIRPFRKSPATGY